MSEESPRGHLGRQAEDIIEQDTTWSELAAELDVSVYTSDDPYADWHQSKPFAPMFKAILWAKTEDESLTGIPKRLEDTPELARALGFDPDDLPHGDTFTHTWNTRFEDLQTIIEVGARHIDEIATEHGSPIGASGITAEETDGSSKRQERRLLRKKTREVLEEMSDIVFPALDIPRPDGAIYSEEELLELLTVMGLDNVAANNGADINSDRLFEQHEPDEDDPFYVDGPTGETLLEALHDLAIQEIIEMVNDAAARTVTRMKPYVEFTRPVFMAIDITYIAYYGDRDEFEWATGAPDDKEYSYCYKIATASIVGENVHLVLGMLPIGKEGFHDDTEYPGDGDDQTFRYGKVVRDLLDMATDLVSVECVYADRAFATADVIDALQSAGVYYVIPAPRNHRLKRWLHRNVDTENGIIAVEPEYTIYGPVKGGSSQERVTTRLVGLPGDPDAKQYGYGESATEGDVDLSSMPDAVPFFTNKDLKDEIAKDRREAKVEIEKYSRRGGIETSYEKIKEFASYTTSWDFSVRLFEYGFAVVLYNIWLLVDFLVQTGLDVEVRSKPRITAKRFTNYVNRYLSKLI